MRRSNLCPKHNNGFNCESFQPFRSIIANPPFDPINTNIIGALLSVWMYLVDI